MNAQNWYSQTGLVPISARKKAILIRMNSGQKLTPVS